MQIQQGQYWPQNCTHCIHRTVKTKNLCLGSRGCFIRKQSISCTGTDAFTKTIDGTCKKNPKRVNKKRHHGFGNGAECIPELHKRHLGHLGPERLRALKELLEAARKSPQSFGELAKKHSGDTVSAGQALAKVDDTSAKQSLATAKALI